MTLCINQVPVDFTLDRETTVADLERSLRAWAHTQELVVLTLLADGRADGSALLQNVERVDAEVVSVHEAAQARASVLVEFLGLVEQAARAGDRSALEDLRSEVEPVVGALADLGVGADDRAVLEGPWDDGPVLAQAVARLALEAQERTWELDHPHEAVNEAVTALRSAAAGLVDVPTLFHRGEDRAAFDRILGLFTHIATLARRTARLPEAQRAVWDTFQSDLAPFLRECEGAMETQDFVLLGDLLEYEIGPRISELAVS